MWRSLLKTPLDQYDALIELDEDALAALAPQRQQQTLFPTAEPAGAGRVRANAREAAVHLGTESVHVSVGLDPVDKLVAELRLRFSHHAW